MPRSKKPPPDVTVGGKKYETEWDGEVQRFKANGVLKYLVERGALDLNHLALAYHQKKFSQRDYAEFNMMLGYSISGFCDLSSFDDMEIINPLWKEEKTKHG